MKHYIQSMHGSIQKQRGYGQNGLELVVTVSFDADQFRKIKNRKNQCPLQHGMAQIKNVVLDAVGVRGIPSYSAPSMNQRWPRASKGLVTLQVYFGVSEYVAKELGVDASEWNIHHSVDLNTTLEATRQDGHLFAKSVLASHFGH